MLSCSQKACVERYVLKLSGIHSQIKAFWYTNENYKSNIQIGLFKYVLKVYLQNLIVSCEEIKRGVDSLSFCTIKTRWSNIEHKIIM